MREPHALIRLSWFDAAPARVGLGRTVKNLHGLATVPDPGRGRHTICYSISGPYLA